MRNTTEKHTFTRHVSGALLPPLATPSVAEEANHRIANSLQIVSAMISGEARMLSDAAGREALYRTQARISAIAGLHRLLQDAGGDAKVDLGSVLDRLCAQFAQYCPEQRRLIVEVDSLKVSANTATLISILTTELLTNACKFAYDIDETGDIFVNLQTLGSQSRLTIEDHGRGPGGHIEGTGLGQRLINSIIGKLGGVASWEDAAPGLRFRLLIKHDHQ